MRRIRARRAIAKVLLANPNGITAVEIIDRLDPKISRQSISDARHVSNLLRGAKGVKKTSKGSSIVKKWRRGDEALESNERSHYHAPSTDATYRYRVALYEVVDARALEEWVA